MTDFLSVFITTSTREEAERIALALVEERLAACGNVLPDVSSIYRWQGKIERAVECALVVKTHKRHFDDLQKRVKELHSYECPCIVATPITEANADYLRWLDDQLA